MTNYCVVGGRETDDPSAANFWTPRANPRTGLPYTNTDRRLAERVGRRPEPQQHVRRRSSTATSVRRRRASATSFAGPVEASEPEIQNELWIADTFDNIKFSNNIHSFGGYFMWAPGAYLPDRGEGQAVHANIGVEKYFFAAGDQILNRIKEVRGTRRSSRSGPVRSRTSSTRRPGTAPTSIGTTAA